MELDFLRVGTEYISASRAAEKVGYASDYIGQLCRSGKVPGKLVGRTWYVDQRALELHKKSHKPGRKPLLVETKQKGPALATFKPLGKISLAYMSDDGPLLPLLREIVSTPKPHSVAIVVNRWAVLTAVVLIALVSTSFVTDNNLRSQSAVLSQGAALAFFDSVSDAMETFMNGFKNLKDLSFAIFDLNAGE